MLTNFFKLNGEDEGTVVSWSRDDFIKDITSATCQELTDRLYKPDTLSKNDSVKTISKKNFRNVSFSKTGINGLIFRECNFEDCLFIGANFEGCEFHHCVFKSCNFYMSSFSNCYADPHQFVEATRPLEKYANIDVRLFQSLATNAFYVNQLEHRATGEFFFNRARRFQLKYERRKGKIGDTKYYLQHTYELIREITSGYGWRPLRVARSIAIAVGLFVILNHYLWPLYGITLPPHEHSWLLSFFFTMSTLTTLGPSGMMPTNSFGLLMVASQGAIGILFFALIASIFFRLIVKG